MLLLRYLLMFFGIGLLVSSVGFILLYRAFPKFGPWFLLALKGSTGLLVEPTYAVIARNRHRISRLMGDGDCSLRSRA